MSNDTANQEKGQTMAMCPVCDRPMLEAAGCSGSTITLNSKTYKRIPYGSEPWWADADMKPYKPTAGQRCGDCAATVGGLHHKYCDSEQCPRCGAQAVCCDCLSSVPSTPACSPRTKGTEGQGRA